MIPKENIMKKIKRRLLKMSWKDKNKKNKIPKVSCVYSILLF